MKAFIDEKFWTDPDIEDLAPKTKLAFIWCITNPARDLCGFTQVSHKRFAFETGLEVEDLKDAIKALPKGLQSPSKGVVWSKNFVAYQFGKGEKLARNNMSKGLVSHLLSLDKELQDLFLDEYPEIEGLMKPLQRGKSKSKSSNSEYSEEDQKITDLIWNSSPIKARKRSSQDKVKAEWAKIQNKPSLTEMEEYLKWWSKQEEWEGDAQYAQGVHIFVKERKWLLAKEKSATYKTLTKQGW